MWKFEEVLGDNLTIQGVAAVLACLIVLVGLSRRLRKSLPLPPGPPSLPLIGHLHVIPLNFPEVAFHEISKTYGDLVFMHVPGRNMVIVNNQSSAVELLEKRGLNYSDRPRFTMLVEMMGWDPTLTLMPYSKRSQKHRRMLQQHFASGTLLNFQPYQTLQAIRLARNIIDNPADYEHYVKRYVVTLIMKIAFGHEVTDDDDEYIRMAKDVTYTLDNSGAPGATPPDLMPFLKHVPQWLPFASFAKFAHNWRGAVRKIHDLPYDIVLKQQAEGIAVPSFLTHALDHSSEESLESEDHVEDIKGVAANIFCAGNDTTFGSILVFLLAITSNPGVQERARKEIEEVIGKDRLPTFEDRSRLPFVECVVQETFRWHPVLPLGIPHRSVEDDVYAGYHIPAGTVIIANAYAMARDDKVYHDPTSFSPERFLPAPFGRGEPYFDSVWGFGRRVCPGKPLADASLWIAVATILATLDIRPGDSAEPATFVAGGIISYPENINCKVKARNENAEHLIRQAVEHHN